MKNRLPHFLALFFITTSLCHAQTPILWGMTSGGGQANYGMMFSLNTATDVETNVHSFTTGIDGYQPGFNSALIQASNGFLYGALGGGNYNKGAIISYDIATGVEADVYNFGPSTTGVLGPSETLVQAGDSLLYGTSGGGANGVGTIFSYNIYTGVVTDLYDFNTSSGGVNPGSPLIEVGDSLLYGTARSDKGGDTSIIFSYNIHTGQV